MVGALTLTARVRQERPAEAREAARRTEQALDERSHPWETGLWRLFHSELLVAGARGDLDGAERLHRRAPWSATAPRTAPSTRPTTSPMLGSLAAARGESELARVRLERALDAARRSGRRHAGLLPLRGLLALGGSSQAPELRALLERTEAEASPPRATDCPFHLAVPPGSPLLPASPHPSSTSTGTPSRAR